MVKRKFSSETVAVSRRILLTGAAASTSAFILAACGGAVDEGPVPTVTRVPAEGAPPTQPPREEPAATPGGETTPGAGEEPASTPADTGGEAGGETGATEVGPLYAIDIGWRLGDLSTLSGDEIVLTVSPGTTFEMISEGAADHDFVVDELGVDVPVAPGETVEVTIPEDAALGEYRFYCSVPGHAAAGMVGTLVVEEGGAAAPAEEEEPAEEPAEEEAAAPAGAAEVGPLIAIDIGWQLGDLSTLSGDEITLNVSPGTTFDMISEGAAEHDFVVDELGVNVPVAPGETVQVTIPEDAALGEYQFYCSVPGHAAAGMVGTLVVEEGGAAAPAGDEEAAEEPAEEETADESAATPAAAAEVGPLIAIDIGWVLGDLNTLNGDAITLTVTPGTTFDMISEGAAEHDFVVDELGIEVPVAPGETTQVTIPDDAAPGEYKFYCSVPGHEAAGMYGTLLVQEGGAAAEEPAAEEDEAASEEPADDAPAAASGDAAEVGPLIAIDIGWVLGDLNTLNGDQITLTVAPGTTFDMVSEGAAEHDFVVDELDVKVPVAPGETVQVTIPEGAAPGEYKFYCSIAGHEAAGMVGTLVVEEGGGPSEAPADEEGESDDAVAAATPAATPADSADADGDTEVGPLIAIDIGWVLGDLNTLNGDAVVLTVSPGTTFEMISEGAAEHDFVVDELGIEVPVAPGETTEVTIPEDAAPGEYEFYCSIPGHAAAGMVGTLVVE